MTDNDKHKIIEILECAKINNMIEVAKMQIDEAIKMLEGNG